MFQKPRLNSRPLVASAILSLVGLIAFFGIYLFDTAGDFSLKPGITYEKHSPGNGLHLFRFRVVTGWYLRLDLEQIGVDVRMAVHGPSGALLYVQDGENRNHGAELIALLVRETGNHILEIAALDPSEQGVYRLTATVVPDPGSRENTAAKAFDTGARAVLASKARTHENDRQALALFEQAGTLWRNIGEPEQEALTLLKMQELWARLHRRDRQIECLRQAASLFHDLGKKETCGLVFHNLGTAYYRSGAFEKAVHSYDRALAFRTHADRDRAETLNQLALVHLVLGRLKECERFLDRAAEIYRTLDDPSGLARIYQQHGRRLSQQADHGRAIAMFERALALVGDGNDPIELTVFNGLGKALTMENRLDEALLVFEKALKTPLLQRETYADWKLRLEIGRSEVLIDLGLYGEAMPPLRRGLQRFKEADEHEHRAHVLFHCAKAQRGIGDLDKALKSIESVLEILDRLRLETRNKGIRADYVSARFFYHEFYLSLLMELGETDSEYRKKAYLYLEHIRARNLTEALARGSAVSDVQNQPVLAAQARELQTQIAEITWKTSRATSPEETMNNEEIGRLLRQYDWVMGSLGISYDATALSYPELGLAQIQNRLLDEHTVLLTYAFGEDHTWLWLVDDRRFETFKLAGRNEVESRAREFYKRLKHRDVIRFRDRVAEVGQHLGQLLLAPVAGRIHGKRLLISADGALKYIPFGALASPQSQDIPLAVHHEIVYVHSMKTLAALRERNASKTSATDGIAIFAAPAFHPDSGFPGLFYAVAEARAIAEIAPGQARIFEGYGATKAEALARAGSDARILHFATHGLLNLDRSELSALVLANTDREGHPIDGFLRSYEIQAMDLKADLVVLSACESALGKCRRGEGLVGLPQSFLEAGARGVLVSLWELEDRATATMMTHFYRHLFTRGKGAAAALRYAQSVMRQSEGWHDPYYWAGFVFLGDWLAFSD